MRIQHNIMAMNAYRNYNNNNKALSGNLEKLSSGYKINRAGDDAAGLAISEKMRAQITGLNAAQKNVKDGTSLVKTAEGAMQEIQDMLNRMDYLATQSANGTYDNEVDRLNLQKEVTALKDEINRIADSANFNGIKLLDGSLDSTIKSTDQVTETVTVDPTETEALTVGGKLAGVGQTLGVDTVLHNDKNGEGGTSFDVDLHNFKFDVSKVGNNMTLKVGDTEFKLTVTTATQDDNTTADVNESQLTGEDLVNAILGKDANISVEVNGKKLADGLTFENDGIEYTDNTTGITKLTIGGQEFDIEATNGNTTANGSLSFTQTKAPTNDSEVVNGSMEVTITGATAASKAQYSADINKFTAGGTVTIGDKEYDAATIADASATLDDYVLSISDDGTKVLFTAKVAGTGTIPEITVTSDDGEDTTAPGKFQDGSEAVTAVYSMEITLGGTPYADNDTITIGGQTINVKATAGDITPTDAANPDKLAAVIAAKLDGNVSTDYDITANGNKIIFTAKNAGEVKAGATGGVPTAAPGALTATGGAGSITFGAAAEDTKGADATAITFTYDLSKWDGKSAIEVDGVEVVSAETAPGAGDATAQANVTIGNGTYTATISADGKTLTLTDDNAGKLGGSASTDAMLGDASFKTAGSKEKIAMGTIDKGSDGKDLENITQGSNGDWNVSTTNVKQVNAGGLDRLASTYFELTEDMIKDGSVLTIGGQDYTFTTDKVTLENDSNAIDVSSGDLAAIAQKLTETVNASKNEVWSVGVGKTPTTITLTETEDHAGFGDGKDYDEGTGFRFDLSTKEGIEASLGFKGVSYTEEKVVSEATEGGKALTLQIGDTSDEFNQLKVSVGDMHVKAMKYTDDEGNETSIADIDIGTQEGAQKAVDVIKASINYVSGVRGDLGAIQNRLDHTANNLSVMAENIQDAESTIRDTDVAEEMMSYVKNNILVQSAQAMLAQANQVPQGVLQLLG